MRQTASEIVYVTILWPFDLDPLLAILEVLSMSILHKSRIQGWESIRLFKSIQFVCPQGQ